MIHKLQQPRVGILRVLDQQHHRLGHGEPLEEQPPPGEQLLPGQRDSRVGGHRHPQQPTQPHPHIGALGRIRDELGQPVGQLHRGDIRGVLLRDVQPLPHDLRQRPEHHPIPIGQTPTTMPPHLPRQTIHILLELPPQP